MNVKTDTKEKFTVFTPVDSHLPAIMTAELGNLLRNAKKNPPHNVILNLGKTHSIDETSAKSLAEIHEEFYASGASFVVCCMHDSIENALSKAGVLSILNYTPTESEAWDIIQMEEIERELLADFNDEAETDK